MNHEQFIFTIIFASGFLGGLANFYQTYDPTNDTAKAKYQSDLSKSVLLSLCAAFSVPLFLQILSNNLLDLPKEEAYPVKNYFILTGFCILAAVFSKRFLDDLYQRVNKAEKENEKQDKEIKDIKSDLTEPNIPIESLNLNSTNPAYSKGEFQAVIAAILNSKYIFRTVDGIYNEIKKEGKIQLSKDQVIDILNLLKEFGYARKKIGEKGEVWQIVIPQDFFMGKSNS